MTGNTRHILFNANAKQEKWQNSCSQMTGVFLLVNTHVGIRLTASFVITFFFGNSFSPITQRKIISLSLFWLPTWQDKQLNNSSALIGDYGKIL